MSRSGYTIKRALLVVLGLDTLLLFTLLLTALLFGGDAAERAVFTIFFVPALFLFLECFFRRITVTEEGLTIRKFGRTKAFSWREVTRVGCLAVHKKVYLLLTTVNGLFVVSSAFGGFARLVEEIVDRVEPEKVEQDVRSRTASAGAGVAVVVPAWIAAVFMLAMILMKWYLFIV